MVRCYWETEEMDALKQHKEGQRDVVQLLVNRNQRNGVFLTAVSSCLNGTKLLAKEFRDNLHLHYGKAPLVLQLQCTGYGAKVGVKRVLTCACGGLILVRYNDVSQEWEALCAMTLTPSSVSCEPKI